MKELLFILAGTLPEEKLVEQLQDSINEWQKDRSIDNFRKIGVTSSLIVAKMQIDEKGGAEKGIMQALKEIDDFEKIKNLTTPPKN